MPSPSSVRSAFESLSIVIPAYNAQRHLNATLDDVQQWLAANHIEHEIIVVDDGSRDDTARLAECRAPQVRLLRNQANRGKGYSVRRGMLETRHAWALFMDVDNSTRIHHLERFAPLAATSDVIIASRRLTHSQIVRRQHRVRQLMGRTFPMVVRALVLPEISDTQCGFKAFRREAVQQIFARQRIERFAFDVELLVLAKRLGLRTREVPVDWDNPTDSTVRMGRDSANMLLNVLALAWRCRFGRVPAPLPLPQ